MTLRNGIIELMKRHTLIISGIFFVIVTLLTVWFLTRRPVVLPSEQIVAVQNSSSSPEIATTTRRAPDVTDCYRTDESIRVCDIVSDELFDSTITTSEGKLTFRGGYAYPSGGDATTSSNRDWGYGISDSQLIELQGDKIRILTIWRDTTRESDYKMFAVAFINTPDGPIRVFEQAGLTAAIRQLNDSDIEVVLTSAKQGVRLPEFVQIRNFRFSREQMSFEEVVTPDNSIATGTEEKKNRLRTLSDIGGDYFSDGERIYELLWTSNFKNLIRSRKYDETTGHETLETFDAKTFHVLGECWESGNKGHDFYAVDANGVYCGNLIMRGADQKTFKIIPGSFGDNISTMGIAYLGKDDRVVYVAESPLLNAKSASFHYLGGDYFMDSGRIFFVGETSPMQLKELTGVDLATFIVLPGWERAGDCAQMRGYAKDKNRYYKDGEPIPGTPQAAGSCGGG